ncbi:MAG: DNA cytosine methyltransferase, partial [Planktomarina sp.]
EIWYDHLHRLERHAGSNSGFDLQYEIYSELMNSADYGVPQKRERYFIVGFRKDIRAQFSFPSATHSKEALLNAKFFDRSYFEDHDIAMVKNNLSANAIRRLEDWRGSNAPKTIRWRTVRDALVGLPAPKAAQSGYWASRGHKYQSGAKSYKGHTGSPLDEPAKTLKAGVHGVPGGENMLVRTDGSVRYFTMREAARLQTFSDTYVFQGAWSVVMRQLGNAVPVALAQAVLKSVATSLIEADMQVLSQTSPNARAI